MKIGLTECTLDHFYQKKTPKHITIMRVLKIIQANPEIFNAEQNENQTEIEAIKIIASMSCKGNERQNEDFEIRQTHTAICNLLSLGFRKTAIDLAIKLIPKAEKSQHYKVAKDLCDRLIKHFFHVGNLESVYIYKTLYDKFNNLLSYEHESMLLYGKAIQNYKDIRPLEMDELKTLLEAVKNKLPTDNLWYRYYYYQFKSFMSSGKDLENIYLEAIGYFENLHFNHTSFIHYFSKQLIQHYQQNNEIEKAKILMKKQNLSVDPGSNN